MASKPKPASDVSTNGHHAASNGDGPRISERKASEGLADSIGRATGETVRLGQRIAGRAVTRAAKSLAKRLQADLDDRDPDYIRENLPLSWLMATIWYRAEVRRLTWPRQQPWPRSTRRSPAREPQSTRSPLITDPVVSGCTTRGRTRADRGR